MLGINRCWRPAKAFVHMSHNLLKCQYGGGKYFFPCPEAAPADGDTCARSGQWTATLPPSFEKKKKNLG